MSIPSSTPKTQGVQPVDATLTPPSLPAPSLWRPSLLYLQLHGDTDMTRLSACPRPTNTAQDGGMWSTHPRHPEDHGMRYFDTTTAQELENGLRPREDLVLPPVGEGQGPDVCRGGHEKASTNYHVFPFGHAKNNFYCTPGNRSIFNRTSSMLTRGAAPSPGMEDKTGEPKRFGRRYAFTGASRRAGARVFYDENVQ